MGYPSAMRLRLHTRYQNSAGERVRIVLNLKRVPYDYVAIPSLSEADYGRINPQHLMPALEIEGRIVTQSLAIIELIEELFPDPPILPRDPILRAQARAFAGVIAADLHPITVVRVRNRLVEAFGADEAGLTAWTAHWMASAFDALETHLAARAPGPAFAFGNAPGIAEACLVPQMRNARRFGFDLSAYPLLVALDAACNELDAFRRAAPEQQADFPGREV